MDRKTAYILNLAKFGGYLAVLWVVFSHSGFIITGPLIPFFFVFASDSIRSHYLDAKMPSLNVPSLYLQMLIVFIFIFLDGTSVGGILLVILIAESLLIYPRPNGDRIFIISLIGFPAVSAIGFSWRSMLNWDNMAVVLINCLFFFFAYAFSYMARRQIEEKERAENALEQLERSRLARDYSGSGIRIQFELDEELDLTPSLETTLYRIIQESITNSVRHGEANLIKVRLR